VYFFYVVMWFCKMLVLHFHRKWLTCWIQSLLLLARTFIVGPEWQGKLCDCCAVNSQSLHRHFQTLRVRSPFQMGAWNTVARTWNWPLHWISLWHGTCPGTVIIWNDRWASYSFLPLLFESYKPHAFWLIE